MENNINFQIIEGQNKWWLFMMHIGYLNLTFTMPDVSFDRDDLLGLTYDSSKDKINILFDENYFEIDIHGNHLDMTYGDVRFNFDLDIREKFITHIITAFNKYSNKPYPTDYHGW